MSSAISRRHAVDPMNPDLPLTNTPMSYPYSIEIGREIPRQSPVPFGPVNATVVIGRINVVDLIEDYAVQAPMCRNHAQTRSGPGAHRLSLHSTRSPDACRSSGTSVAGPRPRQGFALAAPE